MWTLAAVGIAMPLAVDTAAALPFTVPKSVALQLLAYLLSIAILIDLIRHGAAGFPWRHRLHIALLCFLATLGLATAFALDHRLAIWGAYERRLGLVAYVQLGLLYLAAALLVRRLLDVVLIFSAAGAAAVLVIGYAAVQAIDFDPVPWADTNRQIFSTLGNPVVMGAYFSILASAAVAALPTARDRRWVMVFMFFSVLSVVGVLLSGSRGAVLGLLGGTVVGGVLAARRLLQSQISQTSRIVIFAGALTVLALMSGAAVMSPLGSRLGSMIQGTDMSVAERRLIYSTVIDIVRAYPMLGVGPDGLPSAYLAFRPAETRAYATGAFVNQSSAHGWPWKFAVDAGLVGVGAFVAVAGLVLLRLFARLRREAHWVPAGLAGALLAYLFAGLFAVSDLGTEWIFWMAAGLSAATYDVQHLAERPNAMGRGRRRLLLLLLVVSAVGLFVLVNGAAREVAATHALHASRTLAKASPPDALVEARQVVAFDDRWFMHWNNLVVRASEAGDRNQALKAAEKAADVAPYDSLAWLNLANVQIQAAAAERGTPRAEALKRQSAQNAIRAVTIDPRSAEVRAAATRVLLLAGDFVQAQRQAEEAVRLSPESSEYRALVETARRRVEQRENP